MRSRRTAVIASAIVLAALVVLASVPPRAFGAPPASTVKVTLDASQAGPREVEDQTREAIQRDYAKAWQVMAQALAENRAEVLGTGFVGIAKDKLAEAVSNQSKAGLSRKIVDHGHKVQVLFYSPEGSAIQLQDTVQLEVQYLEDGKVVHSEPITATYLAVMTPAENAWRVRILQETAGR